MEHLALEIFDREGTGSRYAALPEDASITITDTSEVFAKGDVWSHSFSLNVRANAAIFGTSGDMHGSRLHAQIHGRRARLWAEGLPLLLGYLRLGDEADVDEDGNVDVTLESGHKTFNQLVEGAKANQVPMMGDVLIGLALWRKRWSSCKMTLIASAVLKNGLTTDWRPVFYEMEPHTGTIGRDVPFACDGEQEGGAVQEYPRMVFPVLPEGTFNCLSGDGLSSVDCLNTDFPYDDAHPYCNTALCYQRYGYEKKDKDGVETVDYDSDPEAQRGYEYMPANRVNSAPNFYVIYWLKALMKHLGIHVEENQMTDVEDLRRLFFVNTKCAYREPQKLRTEEGSAAKYGKYRFHMEGRKIRRLVPEFFGAEEKEDLNGLQASTYLREQNIDKEESKFDGDFHILSEEHFIPDITDAFKIDRIVVKPEEVRRWDDQDRERYERENGYLHRAYATSDCFPDAEISEVIQALESGFGVRLLFSADYKKVRIVLLRSLFRSREVQQVECDVVGRHKTENPVRGFRMTYGDAEDTQFHYKGFDNLLPHKTELWKDTSDTHDYSQWKLDAEYADLIRRVSAFDKTCYVTPKTGNAYGIKIDKDAKRYGDLHPALFEYAGYMDAEDGDCTGEENTIDTVSVNFRPAIMNDLNMEEERQSAKALPRYALFVDAKMQPRRPDLSDLEPPKTYDDSDAYYDVYGKLYGRDEDGDYTYGQMMANDDGTVKPGEFAIKSDMFAQTDGYKLRVDLDFKVVLIPWAKWSVEMNIDGSINEGYRLYLQDNYEPNDSGVSPVETHEWGLTIGIMRGSGGDAHVDYAPDPDDHEGNDTWEVVPGTRVTAHPDTCDAFGREWDYNGTGEGIGPDGRVSLKLRAEKPNPEFDATQPEADGNRRYLEVSEERLKGRGLADQFYREYSYWTRNARIANLTVRMTLAQLIALDKTKRVSVGDITGFVRKMQYSIGNKDGLGLVSMEVMYI